jgi:hypothetical protein
MAAALDLPAKHEGNALQAVMGPRWRSKAAYVAKLLEHTALNQLALVESVALFKLDIAPIDNQHHQADLHSCILLSILDVFPKLLDSFGAYISFQKGYRHFNMTNAWQPNATYFYPARWF